MNYFPSSLKHFLKYLNILLLFIHTHYSYGESASPPSKAKEKNSLQSEKLDKNKDGALSLEEFSKTPKLQHLSIESIDTFFKRLDKNNDQKLQDSELPRNTRFQHHSRKHLEKVDLNKDGKVSLEEFLSTPPPHLAKTPPTRIEKLFTVMDRNKDGFLSPEDKRRPHKKRLRPGHTPPHKDGDQSSKSNPLNREENQLLKAPSPQHLKRLIALLDVNDDGAVDFSEFQSDSHNQSLTVKEQEERFKRRDRNKDGVISMKDKKQPSKP